MPTSEEIKEIERVLGKSFSEAEEIEIPTFIRNRDREFDEEMKLIEELERKAEEAGEELAN